MSPKKITVVDENGGESKAMLSNEEGYKNLVAEYRVACLTDGGGINIGDFESLVDGGNYTLVTMSPKKITVVDASGVERTWKLGNDKGYDNLIRHFGVGSLVDDGNCVMVDFESLADGGNYTLGPPQQQPSGIDNELLRGVKRALENADVAGPTPVDTPASLGDETIRGLRKLKLVQAISGITGQPSVLDAAQLAELSSLSTEHQVVAYLTPFFEEALGEESDIRVVNSEEYPWLVTRSRSPRYNQKPDNIFCSGAIYSQRGAFHSDDGELLRIRRDTDKFGVLSDWRLRDCIDATGEAKLRIDNAGLGEVVNYARHICFRKGTTRTKLILYDKTEFWLVFVLKGDISHIQTCGWNVPGSRRILTDFFHLGRSPWIELLNSARDHWQLTVSHDAFLGMGTFGRVFKVSSRGQGGDRTNFMALKLVLPGDSAERPLELLKEKEQIDAAALLLPQAVVHARAFHNFEQYGAALLLEHVGGEVTRTVWRQVFVTLGNLHEVNIVHGDSRIRNCILVEGSARWIDFRTSAVVTDPREIWPKRRDMETLLKSCFHEEGRPISPHVERWVAQYRGTSESAGATFDAFAESSD